MKKTLLLVLSALAITGCSSAEQKETKTSDPLETYIVENVVKNYYAYAITEMNVPNYRQENYYTYIYKIDYAVKHDRTVKNEYMVFKLPRPKETYTVITYTDFYEGN